MRASGGGNAASGVVRSKSSRRAGRFRIAGGSNWAELTVAEVGADVLELGMVPVLKLSARNSDAARDSLSRKLLKRGGSVIETRSPQSVVAQRAKGADRWCGECRWIEPLGNGVWIRDGAGQVWTVGGIGEAIAALVAAETDIERQTGACRHNTGDLPAANRRFHKPAGAIAEHRYVVDEIDCGNVRSVIAAWTDVVTPSDVGIRNVAEISAAVAGSGRIDGVRQRVVGAKLKVTANWMMRQPRACASSIRI